MKEKYYKVHKDLAARAGLTNKLRQEVDGDFLMLSEKDIRMISFSIEERLDFLQQLCPANNPDAPEVEAPDVTENDETGNIPDENDNNSDNSEINDPEVEDSDDDPETTEGDDDDDNDNDLNNETE